MTLSHDDSTINNVLILLLGVVEKSKVFPKPHITAHRVAMT